MSTPTSSNSASSLFGGGIAGGIGSYLAGEQIGDLPNPDINAVNTLNGIPQQLLQYLQPYLTAGTNAIPGLNNLAQQYGNLYANPGGVINSIGQGYKQSPGYNFALQQGLGAANNAAAAGGMAGTPQAQYNAANVATGLANQDYYNYEDRALQEYNQGLSGQGGIYSNLFNTGASSANSLDQMIAQALEQKAQAQFAGDSTKNQYSAEGDALEDSGISKLLTGATSFL